MDESAAGVSDIAGEPKVGEVTGRFAIDAERRAATVVPPTTPEAEEISLDTLEAVIEALPAPKKPATLPPPVPPEAKTHSLRPYRDLEVASAERAEVEVADLSLRPDNPYLASSLVPPAGESESRKGPIAVGIVVVLALAAGGYFAFARAASVQPVVVPTSVTAPEPEQAPAAPVAAAQEPAAVAAPVVTASAEPVTAEVVAEPAALPKAEPAPAAPAVTEPAVSAPAAAVAAPAADLAAVVEPAGTITTTTTTTTTVPGSVPAAPTVSATAPSAEAAPANLPETPTREQVAAGFDALKPELLQCAAGKTGVVVLDTTLASTGRIAHALIDGTVFKGTPEGSCMARAVRKARFPQFTQPTLKVRYPVQL